jgi:acetyltransferase-like isoleucine patch superfamily enzyme
MQSDKEKMVSGKPYKSFGEELFGAPNVSIFTAGYPIQYEIRNQEIEHAFPVTIGNNV